MAGTAGLGVALLGQNLTALQVVGGMAVLAGALIVSLSGTTERPGMADGQRAA